MDDQMNIQEKINSEGFFFLYNVLWLWQGELLDAGWNGGLWSIIVGTATPKRILYLWHFGLLNNDFGIMPALIQNFSKGDMNFRIWKSERRERRGDWSVSEIGW